MPQPETDHGQFVNAVFEAVTPRYDLANRILSLGLDLRWRAAAVRIAGITSGMRVLDLCCGSGDMAFAAARAVGATGRIVACDRVESMLDRGREKWESIRQRSGYPKELVQWQNVDCQKLTGIEDPFDAAICAFGIRNISCIDPFLRCAHGALRPGGRIAILEFSLPRSLWFRGMVLAYLIAVVPILGWLVTGRFREYRYLSQSILRFSRETDLSNLLAVTGFSEIHSTPLSNGIVTVYTATKQP